MHDTKSLPTYPVRTFVKQILVLFATVLILIPEVYAEDSWYTIDGIKFRAGDTKTENSLRLKQKTIAKTRNSIFPRKQIFPIVLTFKESLMISWSFRQAYFDFSDNLQYLIDVLGAASADSSGGTGILSSSGASAFCAGG